SPADSTVFVVTDLGVYRSTNGGTSWSSSSGLGFLPSGTAIAVDAGNASTIYFGGSSGVYRSTNGGANFTLSNSGIPSGNRVNELAVMNGAVLAGTNGDGAFRSTNSGAAWATANTGLRLAVRVMAVDPLEGGTAWAGTTS